MDNPFNTIQNLKSFKDPLMKIMKKLSVLLCSLVVAAWTLSFPSLTAADTSRGTNSSQPQIAFNFVDVEIPTVIKFISEITKKNFLFDNRIKGKITIIAPTKLSLDESFNLFTSVLSLKGFTIIPSGPNTYKIIPSSLAKQTGRISDDKFVSVNEGYITKLLPIDNIKASEALQFLRPVISRDGHISAFGPRNMLLVVDSGINIDKVMSILSLIDKPSIAEEESQINVYFLEHADAVDMSTVLQGIIKDLQTSYKSARRAKQTPAESAVPILSVTPDKATNALVIVAPLSDYDNILRVIRTLDKKRKQVFVEAMIVEAQMDKLKDLGTKWRVMATHNDEPIAIGGVGNVSSGTILDIITGLSGFSVGGMGNFIDIPVTSIGGSGASSETLTAPGFAALFSLSDFKDAINVLSTPQILTSDNEEAEILVGENVPFISQRERDVVTTNTVLNSIVRTDVGIKLRITPQITEGDYVKLDLFQEISAVKNTSEEILTTVGPTTTKRSTKTSVVVKDGRTVVIGGLMQEREEESVIKIPLLGDIPVLEWLFKFKSVSKTKTNLLVFLSPHIVKEHPRQEETTENMHREFAANENSYSRGELMVKFRDYISVERALEIITMMDAAVIKRFASIDVYHIRLRGGQDVDHAIEMFSSHPDVLYAEPNYKVRIPEPPEERNMEYQVPELNTNNTEHSQQENKVRPLPRETKESSPVEPFAYVNSSVKPSLPISKMKKKTSSDHDDFNAGSSPPTTDLSQSIAPAASPGYSRDFEIQQINKPAVNKYYIQVGAWKNIKYATDTLSTLRTQYPDVYLAKEGTFHKIRIPGTMSRKKDVSILNDLKNNFNLKPILVNQSL